MPHVIHIQAGSVEATAEMNDTKVAQSICAALPLKGECDLWGDEIYFLVPLAISS